MRIIIWLLFILPSLAWAESSIFEFTVLNEGSLGVEQPYKIILNDRDSRLDEIHRMQPNGVWVRVYQGTITHVTLPKDARVDKVYGERARVQNFYSYGDYSLVDGDQAVGLRVKSAGKLVLVTPWGAAQVSWPGEVFEVVQLERDLDMYTGNSFYIFSIRASIFSWTYMVVNSDWEDPHKIVESFRREKLGARFDGEYPGKIFVDSLHRQYDIQTLLKATAWMKNHREVVKNTPAQPIEKWRDTSSPAKVLSDVEMANRGALFHRLFATPSASEVMDELIAQLDDREPMASMPNAEVLASKAIREMLLREFPRLRELMRTDHVVLDNVRRVVHAMTNLWMARKIHDGETMRFIFIKRLEAAVEERAKCELSLLTLTGSGSHALSYDRGEALRGLNVLYRRLYRDPSK